MQWVAPTDTYRQQPLTSSPNISSARHGSTLEYVLFRGLFLRDSTATGASRILHANTKHKNLGTAEGKPGVVVSSTYEKSLAVDVQVANICANAPSAPCQMVLISKVYHSQGKSPNLSNGTRVLCITLAQEPTDTMMTVGRGSEYQLVLALD